MRRERHARVGRSRTLIATIWPDCPPPRRSIRDCNHFRRWPESVSHPAAARSARASQSKSHVLPDRQVRPSRPRTRRRDRRTRPRDRQSHRNPPAPDISVLARNRARIIALRRCNSVCDAKEATVDAPTVRLSQPVPGRNRAQPRRSRRRNVESVSGRLENQFSPAADPPTATSAGRATWSCCTMAITACSKATANTC